jgi:uncharacterized protein
MAKTALVTGASGGIGLEFVERLAKAGYQVTAVARSEGRLKALVGRLGGGHRALAADLGEPADVKRVADDVRASRYDLLVNNAGVGVYGTFAEAPLAPTQAMLRLNVDCLVQLSHAYLSGAKSGDALLNVSSSLALLSFPGAAAYCGSKAFVSAFTEGLWFENKARGVYVAALLPGVTRTNFHEASGGAPDQAPPEAITQSAAAVVEVALAALERRASPTILTSFLNKAMVFVNTRMLPRRAMINLMGGQSPVKPPAASLKA